MKVICKTSVLCEAALNVQKAVVTKTSMPVLEGILMKTQENGLKMTGYDLEIGISTVIEANVVEEGTVIINARTFCDIIKHIPYEDVILEVDDKLQCKIYCGDIEYFMTGINPKDYPELPTIINGKELTVSQAVLKDMVRKTIFSVSLNDIRMIMRGIKFEVSPGELKLVAIDAHRLAIRKEFIEYNGENLNFVVPAKTLAEAIKLIPDTDNFVTIGLGRQHIIFNIEGYTVVSRLLDGEFMNYTAILTTERNTVVRIKSKDMIESVERVSLIITDRFKAPLKMEFRNGEARISTATALGAANDRVDVSIDGDETCIGIQARYVLDALRASEDEEVLMTIVNPLSPVCIVPTVGDAYTYLILPVRLNG